MKIFKVKSFARWAKNEGIGDKNLIKIVSEIQKGLIDANLGGGVFKKRIAVGRSGKSAGARTIVAFKTSKNTFFLFGFMKSEQENIDKKELQALKIYADSLFELTENQLKALVKNGDLFEVK